MADPRVSLVERFLALSFRGQLDEAVTLLAPDATYHIPGSHYPAGTVTGAHQVASHMQEFLEFTHHTVDVLEWEDWMSGVNSVGGLAHMRFRGTGTVHSLRAVYMARFSADSSTIGSIEMFFGNFSEAERLFTEWSAWKQDRRGGEPSAPPA